MLSDAQIEYVVVRRGNAYKNYEWFRYVICMILLSQAQSAARLLAAVKKSYFVLNTSSESVLQMCSSKFKMLGVFPNTLDE